VTHKAETWNTLEELMNQGSGDVTVVEMMKTPGQDIGNSTRWTVLSELRRLGVKIQRGTEVVAVLPEGVEIKNAQGRDLLKTDSVVVATGSLPENRLMAEIDRLIPEVYIIGDAKKPRNAMEAINEGSLTGLKI
jgi:2,4-dienoyl-CoA reductase (NADPH2)